MWSHLVKRPERLLVVMMPAENIMTIMALSPLGGKLQFEVPCLFKLDIERMGIVSERNEQDNYTASAW